MKPPRAGGAAPAKRPSPTPANAPVHAARPVLQPLPFKPRRKLFVVLMIVFALWVAALVVMYFATVHSDRDAPPLTPSPTPMGEGRGEGSVASDDQLADAEEPSP